jgi:hypothetical protein
MVTNDRSAGSACYLLGREHPMLEGAAILSTIRTPSPYPESRKRYIVAPVQAAKNPTIAKDTA